MDVIVYDKLDGIAKGVEYNGGGISSLDKKVDDVTQKVEGVANDVQAVGDIPLLKNGVVKSVQRGTIMHKENIARDKVILSVNLNTVNPQKCIVTASAAARINSKDELRTTEVCSLSLNDVTEFTSNKICFDVVNYGGHWLTPTIIWQVIEFY